MQENNRENIDELPTTVPEDEDDYSFDEDDFDYSASVVEDTPSHDAALNGTEDEHDDFNIDSAEDDGFESDDNADSDKESLREEKKQRSKELRRLFLKKAKRPFIISISFLLLVIIGLFVFSLSTIKKDKVMNNVYIDNLNAGGLTYDETLASINATYLFENSEITLTDGNETFTINAADIGLTAIPEETAKRAFDYSKNGNVFQNAFNAFMLLFKPHVIVPAAQLDTALLDEKLNEFGNISLGERIQHYVAFDESTTAVVYSGQTGYNEDPSEAREQVLTAIDNEQLKNIFVTFTSAPPDDMTPETLDLLIYKDPVDARYEINGNEVAVIDGETGRYINKEEVAPLLENVYEGCEPVGIPFYISEPNITSESLQEKLFANTLSSYSTSYGGSTANRCANVARAASLINGAVVAPGDVFSFNDTVGSRTRENGFYTAKEYINGESVDGIGGGTCQVSSTLYSAVLYADLGIVERLNHMMSVGYIPLGQDATVSDGGVDFKFRNTSDYPIKVSAYTTGSSITVSIIGTAWDPARDVKISNSTSSSGQNTVVYSTRYVYSNGELISTDTLNSSTYMPHNSTASSSNSGGSSSSSSYDDDDD